MSFTDKELPKQAYPHTLLADLLLPITGHRLPRYPCEMAASITFAAQGWLWTGNGDDGIH